MHGKIEHHPNKKVYPSGVPWAKVSKFQNIIKIKQLKLKFFFNYFQTICKTHAICERNPTKMGTHRVYLKGKYLRPKT